MIETILCELPKRHLTNKTIEQITVTCYYCGKEYPLSQFTKSQGSKKYNTVATFLGECRTCRNNRIESQQLLEYNRCIDEALIRIEFTNYIKNGIISSNNERILQFNGLPDFTAHINLHSLLSQDEWFKIRKRYYKQANYRCEICGVSGIPLHCHEHWIFDFTTNTEMLDRVMAICELCHVTIHYRTGRTRLQSGKRIDLIELLEHYCRVNNCSPIESIVDLIINDVQRYYRNLVRWHVDFCEYEKYISINIRKTISNTLAKRELKTYIDYSLKHISDSKFKYRSRIIQELTDRLNN